MITHTHYLSIVITLALVSLAGIVSSRYVRTASDFTVGGRQMGGLLVGGSLIGSFAGGTAIIGTAQMAYQYGISSLWFTLGAGLACLAMGATLVRPLRARGVETVPQLLAGAYGDSVRPWVAAYTSAGIFIQIAAQNLAAIPILTSLFPLSPQLAAVIFTAVLLTYVFLGGFWGAGLVGIFKTVLIIATIFTAGAAGYHLLGGYSGAVAALPVFPWLSPFPRGVSKEAASVFSVVVGFVSTQTYIAAVFAGKTHRSARRGVFLAAFLIPLIGFSCAAVGLFMRARHPGMNPGAALPNFLIDYLPPWLGGAALATLLVSVVLTGAALALSVATVLAQDIYGRRLPFHNDRQLLRVSRALVLLVGLAGLAFTLFNLHTLILEWAFLSMALRGVTVFLPLLFAIAAAGGRFSVVKRAGGRAIVIAPCVTILWAYFFPRSIDPLYVGMFLSLFLLLSGLRKSAGSIPGAELRPPSSAG